MWLDGWTLSLSLSLSPSLMPQKENELMFVGSAATCCGGL